MTMPDSCAVKTSETMGHRIEAIAEEMRLVRHHLHRHPELAFEEHQTAALIADKLNQWGYTVTEKIGGTGIVGQLRNGTGGRSLGLRADMDALPITEQTGLTYQSERADVMHACGHDGHMAMLLGAARYLAQTRSFSGVVNLIFQPAEEKGFESGAAAMLKDGLFDRFPCDRIYAIHNLPGVGEGIFLFREGGFLAAGDRVFVKVLGKGGHAARPHHGVDPIVTASAIVLALQTVVSRSIDPEEATVLTVSRFLGGKALNIIPNMVELGLSIRSFDESVRQEIKKKVIRIITSTAEAYGATTDIEYIHGYPVVRNEGESTRLAATVAMDIFGNDHVIANAKRSMGSEDFAYLLERVPGAMIRIGNGVGPAAAGLHTAGYDFNDKNLVPGIRFWCALAETYLRS